MMPYTPTEWSRGDVVTSEKLNKLEQGVAEAGGGSGGGYLKVGIDMQTMTLDKTWKEIYDAVNAGYYVSIVSEESPGEDTSQLKLYSAYSDNGQYYVSANTATGDTTYVTNTENGYPDKVKYS